MSFKAELQADYVLLNAVRLIGSSTQLETMNKDCAHLQSDLFGLLAAPCAIPGSYPAFYSLGRLGRRLVQYVILQSSLNSAT